MSCALAAAALLLTACPPPGGGGTTTPTYTTTVTGTVQDAARTVGLPGAVVSASTATAVTGSDGAFRLQVTHSGSFTLTVAKTCYQAAPAQTITAGGSGHDAKAIALTPVSEPTGNDRFTLKQDPGTAANPTYTLTVNCGVRTITAGEFASNHSSASTSVTANTRLAGSLGATNQHRKLTVIELPKSLIRIEKQVFAAHQKVVGELTIPPTVEHIGDNAFYHLSSISSSSELVRLNLPPNSKLKFIGSQAFFTARIRAFPRLPQSLETVEEHAFRTVGIPEQVSDFVISENVKQLGDRALGISATFQGTLTIESPHLVRTPADTVAAKTGRLGDAVFFEFATTTSPTSPFTQIILHKRVFDSYTQADLDAIFGTGGSYVDIADRTTPLTK